MKTATPIQTNRTDYNLLKVMFLSFQTSTKSIAETEFVLKPEYSVSINKKSH